METYTKLLEILIQANQAYPRLGGLIFKYYKGSPKRIEVIRGKKAKFGVLLRSAILMFAGCLVLIRIGYILINKTNGKLTASQMVNLNLCMMTFFVFMVTSERYRFHGSSPEHFASFANSLFQMEKRNIKGISIISVFKDPVSLF